MGSAAIQGKLWGTAAEDWTELMEPLHTPLFDAMLSAGNVGEGTRVLDVGCGGGGASVRAAQMGARPSGLDAAESLLRVARERLPVGEFRTGDMESMPYRDGTFDAVIAASSVQFAADKVAALKEMRRVCKSGGRVVAGLFSTPDKVEYRVVIETVRNLLPEPPSGGGPFALSAPGMLEGLFEAAGLSVLHSDEVDCPFTFRDFETLWRACRSAGPIQGPLRIIGEERLRSALRQAIVPYQNATGAIEMANRFRYVVADRI